MRTTLDLPDETFRELKTLAARQGVTLKSVLRRAVEKELRRTQNESGGRRVKFPVLDSKEPASLDLSNAEIEELLT